jgi:endonuclease/exonuclease/phosphatase family metal-dependent hydrolase
MMAGWSPPRASLTVATYNIHRCYGSDGRFDPQRVGRVLKEIAADVVAVQELETREQDGLDLLAHFAAESALSPIAGPTLSRQGAHYGNALLTRFPATEIDRLDLSFPGREPRGAIDARLNVAGSRLRVVATHLGLVPAERRTQVKTLLQRFELRCCDRDVLLGDINEWFLWGRPLTWLHRHFRRTPAPATFPAMFPLLALDRIWVRPRAQLRSLTRHDTPLARAASDHLPLRAVITLGAD